MSSSTGGGFALGRLGMFPGGGGGGGFVVFIIIGGGGGGGGAGPPLSCWIKDLGFYKELQ